MSKVTIQLTERQAEVLLAVADDRIGDPETLGASARPLLNAANKLDEAITAARKQKEEES